jgi:methionyl-tRNA synthetase
MLKSFYMNKKKVLVTTAIDYTNDVIHIGHAYQKILADCIARIYRKKLGDENVYFLTGTDEHGSTSEKAAKARGLEPLAHVTEISQKDRDQQEALNVSFDRFIRTTDADHKKTAQEFYMKSVEAGDIYKGHYEGLYCDGCESYKTLSELNEKGQCLLHPTREIQHIDEENYFFKWSKYEAFLTELLQNPRFVLPEGKRKEMIALVSQGLKDLPVSRPKYKVSWGIDVPNDPTHVIYVWYDALVNYYTAGIETGFWDDDTYILHVLGKDNAKWHAVLWPAMLKSAGIRVPDTIYVQGFINLNGEKISKSRGNVILPTDLVAQFGVDAVRYYFLTHGPIVEDVNISIEHIKEVYNSDLANGLGNTVARVAKLAEKSALEFAQDKEAPFNIWDDKAFSAGWLKPFETYRVDQVLQNVWSRLAALDKHVNDNKPWEIKESDKLKEILTYEVAELRMVAQMLEPFMPATATKIQKQFGGATIVSSAPLFPRLQ